MQRCLRRADLLVRHAAHHFVDFGEGAIDGLENLECLFLLYVERTFDPLVSSRVGVAIADP